WSARADDRVGIGVFHCQDLRADVDLLRLVALVRNDRHTLFSESRLDAVHLSLAGRIILVENRDRLRLEHRLGEAHEVPPFGLVARIQREYVLAGVLEHLSRPGAGPDDGYLLLDHIVDHSDGWSRAQRGHQGEAIVPFDKSLDEARGACWLILVIDHSILDHPAIDPAVVVDVLEPRVSPFAHSEITRFVACHGLVGTNENGLVRDTRTVLRVRGWRK